MQNIRFRIIKLKFKDFIKTVFFLDDEMGINADGNLQHQKGQGHDQTVHHRKPKAALVKINELEEVYRETLTLRYVDGLRPKEI